MRGASSQREDLHFLVSEGWVEIECFNPSPSPLPCKGEGRKRGAKCKRLLLFSIHFGMGRE